MALFFFGFEEPKNRRYIPHACVAAAATNFLVVIWIAVYISSIYDHDSGVYINIYDRIIELELSDYDLEFTLEGRTYYILTRTW